MFVEMCLLKVMARSRSSLVSQSFWGIADQVVIALANFGVGLLLIKIATKPEFGLYGLSIAAILYLIGLANALITTQMIVLAPTFGGKEDEFCYGLLKTQQILYCLVVLSFLIHS